MNDKNMRIIEPGSPPEISDIKRWIGEKGFKLWQSLSDYIEENYPGIFTPEWLYGGKKHGWSLRYKKSRSFCTFIPEKNRFALLIVFGGEEREKVEQIRDGLSLPLLSEYDKATTYHDGKWLLISVDSEEVLKDVKILLNVKRKIKIPESLGKGC